MIDRILLKKYDEELEKDVIQSNNARIMFLYLYYVSSKNLSLISNKILETKDYLYIHLLMKNFKLDKYDEFIDTILCNDNAAYLYNILYDVDYLENIQRIRLIDKIFQLENEKYIVKALYHYFVFGNLYDEKLFDKTAKYIKNKFNINIDKENYKSKLDEILYADDFKAIPRGFSTNCYKGRKGYIPNIIVCHSNNTFSSAIQHFYNEKDEVSSHFVIRRDGYIKQVISLNDSSWANGTSINPDSNVYYKFSSSKLVNAIKDNANYYTFSIEHESFDGSLTEAQFKSTIEVMRKIIKYVKEKYNYDFIIDREHIIGHYEVNPIVRTKCPGDKFPFSRIIEELKK